MEYRLRPLQEKDAPFMLEWMHDDFVVHNMKTDFASKTMEDCKNFIAWATDKDVMDTDCNLAIVDEQDEYQGTVSIKHIKDGKGEFAITIRKGAMGKGISKWGMAAIIQYGFSELFLREIYWCVSPDNARAVRFYDKNGYRRIEAPSYASGYTDQEMAYFYWYAVRDNSGTCC